MNVLRLTLALLLLVGCDDGTPETDAGPGVDTDAGPRGDAGDAPDAGPIPTDTVPAIVGVGTGFATLFSCDDGRTFTEGRAVPGAECVDDGDCSHDPGRALGVAFSNGWFIASFGNEGDDEHIRRTRDGVTWERVHDGSVAGLAAGNGRVVANENPPLYSDDDGETWNTGTPFTTRDGANNARAAWFVPHDGGRFLLFYDTGGARDLVFSADGASFRQAAFPEECNPQGFAYGGGVALMVTLDGRVCRSTDGGESWSEPAPLMADGAPTDQLRAVLWDGGAFLAYHWGDAFRSADGLSWELVTVTPDAAHIGTHVQTGSGGFVTSRDGNTPMISRSDDGLSWTDVAPGMFVHGFAAGYVPAASCP